MCWVFLILKGFLSRNLYEIILRELCTGIYLLLGGANNATPHYATGELRVLGVYGLGFMLEATLY